MSFLIISHALHKNSEGELFAYEPYVREMNLWLKHVDKVTIVAPHTKENISSIDMAYKHNNIVLKKISAIQFTSFQYVFKSVINLPIILFTIFKACKKADHIHLRCPGNIGLLGCCMQILFPRKIKTAKYAGNWDPKANQPFSYRFQKWILSNTVLTKNIKVLIYGEWEQQSKNIVPFFTATYKNSEIEIPIERSYNNALSFTFVGSLVNGKRPLFAVKIIEELHKQGYEVILDIFGDGVLKTELENYISKNKLEAIVCLHGNQPKEQVKAALQNAHFLILPSKSEGWPKAITEAMFYGTIPVSTSISCVPNMLDYGNRGILIEPNIEAAVLKITEALNNKDLKKMSKLASEWSQNYTLDYFESEIKKLLAD